MEYTVESLMIDVGMMSILLVVAKIIRIKLKILQNAYVPTALIAGLLGLLLGEYGLDIMPFSSQAGSYSGYLFNLLFASLFIGSVAKKKSSFGDKIKKAGDSVCLNNAAFSGIYGVAAVVSATVLGWLFKDIFSGFGVVAATGFAGGHGSASAVGTAFVNGGWEEGVDIANTFATIGLMVGIFLGVALIKIATNKRYTQLIDRIDELPDDIKVGLVKKENRVPLATETVNSMSIESLAWHLALVMSAATIGMLFNEHVMEVYVSGLIFPDYAFALIFGVILFWIIKKIGYGDYVDKKTVNRIGGTITDYLVGFAIAMINIEVVLEYWVPIVMMALIVTSVNLLFLFYISKKMYNTYWFERGIYTFGMCTGVASIGVLLLRIVDPQYKTGILEDVGVALIVMTPLEMLIVTMTPVMFLQGYGLPWGVAMLGISLALLIICKVFFSKKKKVEVK